DKNDPSRRAQHITAESTQQLANRNYRMVRPVAWSFGRNGNISRITAESAEAYIPSDDKGARPENATLKGDVTLSIFERAAAGLVGSPAAVAGREPALVATAPSMRYEGTPGRISTPDHHEVHTDQLDFGGRGLTLLLNEVDQRVEYLKIEKAEPGITYRLHRGRQEGAGKGTGANPLQNASGAASHDAETPNGNEPVETRDAKPTAGKPRRDPSEATITCYHVTAKESVVVTFGDRTIESDGLE